MNAILVEPQIQLAKRMRKNLEEESFTVKQCCNPDEICTHFFNYSYDFVIISLDIENRIPEELIKRIREDDRRCKIIAIGAQHISKVKDSLWLGADDYIQKTCIDELGIRIHLLKRRLAPINIRMVFKHKEFSFHEERSLLCYQSESITLTNIERRILYELFQSDTSVKALFLIDKIWGDYIFNGMDRLMKRVSVLRHKVKKLTNTPLIKTIKGIGYELA